MIKLMSFKRAGNLAHRVILQRYQRYLVDYFLRYTVSEDEIVEKRKESTSRGTNPDHSTFTDINGVRYKTPASKNQKKGMSLARIINMCVPEEKDIDRRIYYEITGMEF